MLSTVLYVIIVAMWRLRSIRQTRVSTAASSLCAECSFAHTQYGANAKVATFCTFGGGVRAVAMDVLFCTDYRDHNIVPRVVRVGFVREPEEDVVPEVAATAR